MQAFLGEHKESTEEWQEDNPVLFYNFLSIVYNLQSNSTLNQYDTLDTNAIDGMLHQTLADMGHKVEIPAVPIGGAQAILIGKDGVLQGASDPRKDGCAVGY